MPAATKPDQQNNTSQSYESGGPGKNVKVLLRLKPCRTGQSVWEVDEQECMIGINTHFAQEHRKSAISYSFDGIFNSQDNVSIYNRSIAEIIGNAFEGINALIFAYGQTCSGKTYTMLGNEQNPGIIFLAMQSIFERISRETSPVFSICYSYFEIYNDKIVDLLDTEHEKEVKLIEGKEGIRLYNLAEEKAHNIEEISQVIQRCESIRHTRETDYNERSSRSHSIFQVFLERTTGNESNEVYTSTITMVDLAGSERASMENSSPEKKRETTFINKSLLSLATVIGKLADPRQRHTHIPYRDSKLTRILQPILWGGSARICIICNIRQERESFEESHRTLIFGQRVNNLDLKPKVNIIRADQAYQDRQEIYSLKRKVELLSRQLAQFNVETEHAGSAAQDGSRGQYTADECKLVDSMNNELASKNQRIQQLEQQIIDLQRNMKKNCSKSEMRLEESQGTVKIRSLKFELDQTISEFLK